MPDRREQRITDAPTGRVVLLGDLSVLDDGGRALGPVPPGRASLLLQRVAVAGGTAVDVEGLVDVLWPAAAPPSAKRTIASLVSRIRKALGPDIVVGSTTAGYRLGTERGWATDLMELESLSDEARRRADGAPAIAATAARRGLDLVGRGVLLAGPPDGDQDWYDGARRRVDVAIEVLRRSALEAEIRLERWFEAVRLAEEALVVDPVDEQAARALMLAHRNLGDRGAALRVYDRLRRDLADELGTDPEPDTEDLHLRILRGGSVAARSAPDAAVVPPSIVLAGREEQFGKLLRAWERAVAGSAEVILISGARGSGRTGMAESLIDVVVGAGGRAVYTRSFGGERSSFLRPLLDLARQLLLSLPSNEIEAAVGPWAEVAAELLPEVAELLPPIRPRSTSPVLEHHRALQMLGQVFGSYAGERPLLLVLDDVHHAAMSTLEAVSWLTNELADSPLLMVGTALVDEPISADERLRSIAEVIGLGPISPSAVAALAVDAGHPEAADFVWDLTHGHLHFVVEVLGLLGKGVPIDDIPSSMQHLAAAEIAEWDAARREVLAAAAVIGPEFDLPTLEALTGLTPTELRHPLEGAVAKGYLETDRSQFTFVNEPIRIALRASLPGPVRNRHELRLAEIFHDQPERRANFLSAAGMDGRAAPAWHEAARAALEVFANADAHRLATKAVDAAERAGDHATLAEALITRGAAATELARYDDARSDFERAGALWLQTGDRSLRSRAVERVGWTAYYRRDATDAMHFAEQAIAMPGDHPGAWALLGRVRHWSGDLEEAANAYHNALADLHADTTDRASVLSCLGALFAHSDRYEEAIEVLDEAVELSNELGAFRPLMRTLFFRGLAQANAGHFSDALTTLETKGALLDRYGVRFYRARTNTCLSWVWREIGDLGRANDLAETALEQSLEVDDQVLQLEQELHARCALADVALARGREAEAAEQLATCRDLVQGWLPFRWRAELRVVEIGARMRDDAPEHLLSLARERRSAKYQALALHLLGRTEEASEVASACRSNLLLAEVGAEVDADRARTELLARLPAGLRGEAAANGRVLRSLDR